MRRKIKGLVKKYDKFEVTDVSLEESDFTRIFDIYKGEELEELPIIKYQLPCAIIDERRDEKVFEILKNGIYYEGIHYVYLTTSPSYLKKDEVLLIDEKDIVFKVIWEMVISLGKVEKMKYGSKVKDSENEFELAINKDIISRISLSLTDGIRVNIKDFNKRICVLPEMKFKHIANYLRFEQIDDDTIDLNNLKLVEEPDLELKLSAFDGCGLIDFSMLEEIRQGLNEKGKKINDTLAWIGIRLIGLASKGMLAGFDWKSYLKNEKGIDSLVIKDFWGDSVDIFDYDCILNGSMCKWAKNFTSFKDYLDSIKSLKRGEEGKKYAQLFEGFNIINYSKLDVKEYTKLNYQILSNLCLTPDELDELAKETVDTFKDIVIEKNTDKLRILLGDSYSDSDDIEEISSTQKIHRLIQINDRFRNTKQADLLVSHIVNKSINQLAGGKIYTKANYKRLLHDPIAYIESLYLVSRDKSKYKLKENGDIDYILGERPKFALQDREIYVNNETGVRVVVRSPLNSATEILKVKISDGDLYKKYLNHLTKDIVILPFDNCAKCMSGADFDLDEACIIDNEIIYNAVIEDIKDGKNWRFHNQFDGKTVKDKFTKETYDSVVFNSIIETKGNLIGKISNNGAIISNRIQAQLNDIRIKTDKEDYETNYVDLFRRGRNELKKNNKYKDSNIDELMKAVNNQIEIFKENKILTNLNITDDMRKEHLLNNFQKEKLNSYYHLYLQQVAIDAPKTKIKLNEDMKKVMDNMVEGYKKPRYLYYANFKEENKVVKKSDTKNTHSLLNNFASKVINEIGVMSRKKYETNTDAITKVMNEISDDIKVDEELKDKLTKIYKSWSDERILHSNTVKIRELENKKNFIKSGKKKYELDEQIDELKVERNIKYNEIDILTGKEIQDNIKNKVDHMTLLKTINDVKVYTKDDAKHQSKISSRFIINFFFEELETYLLDENDKFNFYRLNGDGDITYLFDKYSKEHCNLKRHSDKEEFLELVKNSKNTKHLILNVKDYNLTEIPKGLILVENDKVIDCETGEAIGKLYPDNPFEEGKYLVLSYKCKEKDLTKTKRLNLFVM
ncbi:hypothetical protein NSA42_03200 [Paeniclostridium sordellii]|uniref:hypothetical protein n=1 Tax=Paraclostridium sordellii TaxID=1505 RepID=UPI00214A26C5|nr:hypothetical protein [Paeniclostridium sordellii]MCR1848276.1 hypothetical protein [Paeniclostridium sordellii]